MSNKTTAKKGKKLTSEILSVRSDTGTGGTAEGIFVGLKQMYNFNNEPVKGNYDQDLFTMDLADFDTKELRTYWVDAGLRGTLKLAKVKEGDRVIIEHTGTKKIDDGTVQTYDIFAAE